MNNTRRNFISVFGSDGPHVMQMYGICDHYNCLYLDNTYSVKSPIESIPTVLAPTVLAPTVSAPTALIPSTPIHNVPTQTAHIYSADIEKFPEIGDSTPIVVYVPSELSPRQSYVDTEGAIDVFELSRQSEIVDKLRTTQRELESYKKYLRELEIVIAESLSIKEENNPIASTRVNICDNSMYTTCIEPEDKLVVDPKHELANELANELDNELDNECPICFEREVGKTLIPCGHCFCVQCDTGTNCLICRMVIEHTHIIFL